MSTIHDALKKVQDDMGPQKDSTPQGSQESQDPQKSQGAQGSQESQEPKETQKPPKPHNPFNAATPPPQKPVEEETPEPPKKISTQKLIGIIVIVIILGGLGTTIFLLTSPNRSKFAPLNKVKAIISKKTDQASAPVTYSKDEIVLNGIMTVGKKHVALINGEIYETGDTVNGKQIKQITKTNVTFLDEEGNIETIRISK